MLTQQADRKKQEFPYLGSAMTEDSKCNKDKKMIILAAVAIGKQHKIRISRAEKLNHTLRSPCIKHLPHCSITAVYGAECWTIKHEEESNIHVGNELSQNNTIATIRDRIRTAVLREKVISTETLLYTVYRN